MHVLQAFKLKRAFRARDGLFTKSEDSKTEHPDFEEKPQRLTWFRVRDSGASVCAPRSEACSKFIRALMTGKVFRGYHVILELPGILRPYKE